ncbi:hypothetical protein FRY77_36410 [Halomonas sp. MG34]|nr:hypothetical protein [Halomonas sp. MG34]
MTKLSLPENITNEKLTDLYKEMWLIRFFDEKVDEFFAKGLIHGTTHLAVGHFSFSSFPFSFFRFLVIISSSLIFLLHCISKLSVFIKMMSYLFGFTTFFFICNGVSMLFAFLF